MKNTGIIRRIDRLGRLVIPGEIRKDLGWPDRTALEIWRAGRWVIVRNAEEAEKKEMNLLKMNRNNPLLHELTESLSGLSSDDIMMLLELTRRLKQG